MTRMKMGSAMNLKYTVARNPMPAIFPMLLPKTMVLVIFVPVQKKSHLYMAWRLTPSKCTHQATWRGW